MLRLLRALIIAFVIFGQGEAKYENISRKCRHQFEDFSDALTKQRTWAMKLFDTWGKFQSGVLNGNVHNFGDFESCVSFTRVSTLQEVGIFKGKHCMISYRGINSSNKFNMNFGMTELGILAFSQRLTLESGICVPDSCSINDARELAVYVLSKASLNVTSVSCESNHPIPFRIRGVAIAIFALLLLAVISSTIYELHMKSELKPPCMTLIAFSAFTNSRNLFRIETNNSSKSISCLNGLRALSLLWIIFGHRYFDMFVAPATNSKLATDSWLRNIFSLTHTTFHLAVDNFFLMGGLLVTWTFMKSFDANQFNVLKLYFHRFLRYTPLLLFLLLFFVSFAPYLGTGPIFDKTLENWLPNCYIFWWSTLLHVATYTNINQICLNWTWYLSADFQMFLLSPLLVYPAWRWRWKFFVVFPLLILLSKAYIFVTSIVNEFPVFVGPLQSSTQFDYDRLLYYPTHARCGPFLVGLSLGFVMYQFRNKPPRLYKNISRILWILSISVLFAIFFGYFPFQQPENLHAIPNVVNATYNALYRSSWAIAMAWIIFACHHETGGAVRWFLCLPHFQPLARMSLSIYLTHRIPQIISLASIKQPIHLNPMEMFQIFLGDALLSIAIGIVVYLCIEAPFAMLERRMSKPQK